MTHENSPQAYHVHKEHESVREALERAEWQRAAGDHPYTDALTALDSLLAYIEQLEGERDEAFKWIDVNRTRAEAAERENERLREALTRIEKGDLYPDAIAAAALAARTEEQA